MSRRREVDAVERELSELAVKAPSLEAPVSALSGGNQQKIVMARAMLSEPAILVADEPTQGVDVGARAEIYRILREVAARGVPVVVASSDTIELEGLCDRVIVMSRGQAVATLEGDDVTEERIVHAAISATMHTAEQAARKPSRSSRLARFIEGDYAPVVVLAAVMIVLGAYVLSRQQPLPLGLQHHVRDVRVRGARFHLARDRHSRCCSAESISPSARSPASSSSSGRSSCSTALPRGVGARIRPDVRSAPCGVGLLNGALIRFAKFTPVAATLVTYIALGGLAFRLRSAPDGYIATLGDRRHLHEGRAGASRLRRVRSLCRRPRVRAP